MKSSIHPRPGDVLNTINQLENRIADRFPDSSLRKTCAEFSEIAKQSKVSIDWISKPNIFLRLLSYLIISPGIGAIIFSVTKLFNIEDTMISNIVAISEAVFNVIIFIDGAIFF